MIKRELYMKRIRPFIDSNLVKVIVETVAQIPANVSSAEGREAVKNWLWNHNGDADYAVGSAPRRRSQ